jgi:hypothetical protein
MIFSSIFSSVADYGFTKLIELFEAIPTMIEIIEDADGKRILQLTDAEQLVAELVAISEDETEG